jgi:hypothetical protein
MDGASEAMKDGKVLTCKCGFGHNTTFEYGTDQYNAAKKCPCGRTMEPKQFGVHKTKRRKKNA